MSGAIPPFMASCSVKAQGPLYLYPYYTEMKKNMKATNTRILLPLEK